MDNNVDNFNITTTTTTAAAAYNLKSTISSSSLNKLPATTAADPALAYPILVTTPTTPTAPVTNSFWKNSNRIVPGRPSPKRITPTSTGGSSSSGGGMMATFRDYQNSVSDAWDTGDDEFCIISTTAAAMQQQQQQQQSLHKNNDNLANKTGKINLIFYLKDLLWIYSFLIDPRISRQVSQSLAQNVIEIHKTSTATTGVGAAGHVSNNNTNTESVNQQHQQQYVTKQQQQENPNRKDSRGETQEQR